MSIELQKIGWSQSLAVKKHILPHNYGSYLNLEGEVSGYKIVHFSNIIM